MEVFDDYREKILEKNEEQYKMWKDGKNILYKTIVYELSKYKHVEFCCWAENDFKLYCIDFKERYKTADIMNGWWYCFKILFNLKNRQPNSFKDIYNDNIKNMTNEEVAKYCYLKYKAYDADVYKSFLKYLSIVYTAGNLTPAPINPGGQFETWEYKLNKYNDLYQDGDKEKLLFQDYYDQNMLKNKWTTKDFKSNPKEYFDSRIDLIIKRGIRIKNNNKIITNKELNEELNKNIGNLNMKLFRESSTS